MKTWMSFGVWLLAGAVLAHEGHDHGAPPPVPGGDVAQRLPDGQVFLPKPAQRRLGVLTFRVQTADVPQALTLNGRVVLDPHLGGRVQAMLPGRIEAAGPHGLPAAGSRVRKGETLAWVVPSAGALERAGQAAQLADLKAARALAEKRLARMRELSDTVARKEIEAVEAELISLNGRIAALGKGLGGREALVAPVSGVIAASNAVVGQVVEPKELVFEIANPDSLHVEALAYEAIATDEIAGASVAIAGRALPLAFVGAARRLREQALPLLFENHGPGAGRDVALGQPVSVQVQLRRTVRGLPLPAAALGRNAANEPVVWVKTAPERFAPRPVTTAPLDGERVLVTQGLVDGERVVVQGAALISQIR